jgi:hypothetical protein
MPETRSSQRLLEMGLLCDITGVSSGGVQFSYLEKNSPQPFAGGTAIEATGALFTH